MGRGSKTVTIMEKHFSIQDTIIIEHDEIKKKPNSAYKSISSSDTQQKEIDCVPPDFAATEIEEKYYKEMVKGERDDDKYKFKAELISGGMGTIFNVLDLDLTRSTAMKVVLPLVKQNDETLTSFIREAKITGFLEHPNIIPVHELGFHPDTGLYFTMKLVRGESFSDVLDLISKGDKDYVKKYDEYTLLNIFRKICDAVSFAHSKDIVHLDIKPQNVMVGEFGEVLLMDWGIAKYIGDLKHEKDPDKRKMLEEMLKDSQSNEKIIQGSPAYMSPEHAKGVPGDLDKSSDIFLLGATLYKIVSLEAPHYGESIEAVLKIAEDCDLEPPKITNPRIQNPEELTRIVMKAMSAEKKDRYETVNHMINDLEALISGKWTDPQKKTVAKGELLIKEGEPGEDAYLILRGSVQVYKESEGSTISLGVLKRGDIVGEMALIAKGPRNASVVALEKTDAAVLTKSVLTQNINKLPFFMAKIILSMTDRLRIANENRINLETLAGDWVKDINID